MHTDVFAEIWQSVLSVDVYGPEDTLSTSEQVLFGYRNFGRDYPAGRPVATRAGVSSCEHGYSFHPRQPWLRLIQPYAAADTTQTWFNGDSFDSQLRPMLWACASETGGMTTWPWSGHARLAIRRVSTTTVSRTRILARVITFKPLYGYKIKSPLKVGVLLNYIFYVSGYVTLQLPLFRY